MISQLFLHPYTLRFSGKNVFASHLLLDVECEIVSDNNRENFERELKTCLLGILNKVCV